MLVYRVVENYIIVI